jgi:hypothetical protein
MTEEIHHDESGNRYVLDENGNRRPPMQAAETETHSGFTVYDSSQGHCGLCGRLDCRGGCFR